MKKILTILLALVLVFTLVACGEKKAPTEDMKTETATETVKETETEEVTEAPKETDAQTSTEAPVETGEIAKVGLGLSLKLSGKEGRNDNIQAQQDATLAAVAFDKDGKIVSAQIDTAQSQFFFTKEGKFEVQPADAKFLTKHEKGENYGMKKVSGIQKEWFEQVRAFESYIVGKTIEEVNAIPTAKRDDAHLNVPTGADLVSSVTIDIKGYRDAVNKAWENAKDAEGTVKVGYKAITSMGRNTKESEGEGFSAQFETAISVVGLKEDGTISVVAFDNVQNTVKFLQDGTVDGELVPSSKRIKGEDYGMREASPIKKEWFEQIDGLQDFLVGKTEDEVKALSLEAGKATDADLLATTTITIDAYQQSLLEAIKSAK